VDVASGPCYAAVVWAVEVGLQKVDGEQAVYFAGAESLASLEVEVVGAALSSLD